MRRTSTPTGATLIEMLTYMAIFGVIAAAVYTAYYPLLGYLRKENRQVQLLLGVERAQRRIVQDVRRAIALPDEHASYTADESTLICRIPLAHTIEDRTTDSYVVIYTLVGRDAKSLVRKTVLDDGDPGPDPERVLLKDMESVVFDRFDRSPTGRNGTVRCTITAPKNRMYKSKPTVYSFVAARKHE